MRALQRRLGALPGVVGERWRSCEDARVEFRFFQGRRGRARAVADARQVRADAGAQSFDLVFSASSALRRKHPPEKSDWTFSLIEVSTRPTEALALLDAAGFGSLMTIEGALLNAPTEDWYVPIRAVRALAANRTKVTVVASVGPTAIGVGGGRA